MIKIVYYNDWLRCYRNGVVERLFKRKGWRLVKNTGNSHGYNTIKINDKIIKRHRLIAFCWLDLENIESGDDNDIDHIDGNPLNNHADNLRIVTNQQNHWNRTKAKGYIWNKNANKWQAKICLNGKTIYLGYFIEEASARQAYLDAKLKYHVIT